MRNVSQFCRKLVATAVLLLVLTCTGFAGEMPLPGVTAPPPVTTAGDTQYPGASSTETVDGDTQFPGVTVDSVTGMAVTLWQSAMALF